MATERIQIQITERGSGRVIVNINRIGQSSERAARQSNLLRNALALLGGAAIVRGLTRTADEVTNIQNRLRLVTSDAANLNTVFDELLSISNRTRTSFRENAELFTRTALATRELGLSQRETLDFTERLSQAVILSGASTQEASNAIRQLSQGLQNGALRGEEFRSVSEQLPLVLEVIAEDLGITRGELRELAFDGQLTAETIVNAFANVGDRLEEDFANTVPTIGQAFQVLRSQITSVIANINEGTGVFGLLAQAILFVADNIERFARGTLAIIFVGGVTAAITALRALTAAALANPFTAIITGVTLATAALIAFSDEIKLTEDGVANFADFALVAFDEIRIIVVDLFNTIIDAVGPVLSGFDQIGEGGSASFADILLAAAMFADDFVGVFAGVGAAVGATFRQLPDVITDLFFQAVNGIVEALEFISDGITSFFIGLGTATQSFADGIGIVFINLSEAVNQALAGNVNEARRFLDQGIFILEQRVSGLPGLISSGVENAFDDLRAEDVLQRALNPAEGAAAEAGQAAGDAFIEAFEGTTGNEDLIRRILGRAEIEGQGRVAREELARLQRERERERLDRLGAGEELDGSGGIDDPQDVTSVLEGFQNGFERINEIINDTGALAEETLVNAFGAAEDAFVEFVQTGEFNFSKLVDSILADLSRLLFRQAISGLLGALGGGGGGGGFGSLLGGLFGGGRQEGGPVNPNQAFLVGERGPELFVPPTAGNIVPMEGGAPPQVNVSVVNVTDPNEVNAAIDSGSSDTAIINAIQRNRRSVQNVIGVA